MKMMKRTFTVLSLALLAFSACKKDKITTPPPAPTTAKVMFVNTMVSSPELKVEVNDAAINGAQNLTLLANSGYVDVTPGTAVKTEFIIAESNEVILNQNYDYTVNRNYSVFATGSLTERASLMLQDDLTAPASGKAKVRFINLSKQNLSETIAIGSTVIGQAVNYLSSTGFVEVTASSSANINASDPTQIGLNQTLQAQNLEAGKLYTVMLTGIENGNNNNALKLTLIANN